MQVTLTNIHHWSIPLILSNEPPMTPSNPSPQDLYSTATPIQQLCLFPPLLPPLSSSQVSPIHKAVYLETQPVSLPPSRPNDTKVPRLDPTHVSNSPLPIPTT